MTVAGRGARAASQTAMVHGLPSNVSFGFIGARAIVLDIASDRYFLLSGQEAAAIAELARGGVPPRDVIRRIEDRGMLSVGSGGPVAPVSAPALEESALEGDGTVEPIGLMEVAMVRLRASAALRVAGLEATIDRWRGLRDHSELSRAAATTAGRARGGASAGLAKGFAASRLFVPARRACVPDSLALASCLWHRGASADVYFGVRLDPFAAHCWVQAGPVLLSDPLDVVREFTPVFRL